MHWMKESSEGKPLTRAELRRGFALLEMLYWLTYGAFTTYLVSFVTATRGASATMAGLMLALFMASACVGQYVIGGLCDRRQNNRAVFRAGMAVIIALELAVYFSPNMALLGLGCVCLGFIQPPVGAILDTWLIRSFPDEPGAYSPLRALASLAYAVLMAAMGVIIERVGHGAMPVLSALFATTGILVASRMPEIPRAAAGGTRGEVKLNMLPRVVWLFVLAMGIMGVANIPLLNMNLLILGSVGGTVASMGVATPFNMTAEFLMMRFAGPALLRFSARQRMLGCCVLYVASTVLMILSRTVWLLYLASFINGMAYGILLPARRQYVTEIAPEAAHNRVHGLGDMAYLNFGGLVGNQVSGVLIDSRGVGFMLTVSLCVQVIGLAVMSRLKGAAEKNKK